MDHSSGLGPCARNITDDGFANRRFDGTLSLGEAVIGRANPKGGAGKQQTGHQEVYWCSFHGFFLVTKLLPLMASRVCSQVLFPTHLNEAFIANWEKSCRKLRRKICAPASPLAQEAKIFKVAARSVAPMQILACINDPFPAAVRRRHGETENSREKVISENREDELCEMSWRPDTLWPAPESSPLRMGDQ